MKKIIWVAVIIVAAFALYWFKFRDNKADAEPPKQEALKVSKHSPEFSNGLKAFMNAYFALKGALVDADTLRAREAAKNLVILADSFNISELKKDPAGIYETAFGQLGDVKANTQSLLSQKDITEMRKDFSMVSESVYPLLKAIHYEGNTLYWQNCPMAFGDDKGANWISNTEEIINPYLGKNHPKYKATMLECGMVMDSIKAD